MDRICCPYRQVREEAPDPPCRPPISRNGTLTLGFLPEDHPHGKRYHLSPVDFGILRSPRIADKLKLKMSKKSSRILRKELDQLSATPYNEDAHVLTSNEVLDMADDGLLASTKENSLGLRSLRTESRGRQRFGTLDPSTDMHVHRLAVNSPSIYSRSESRAEGEPLHVAETVGVRKAASAWDMHGTLYRSILPRPLSDTCLSERSAENSRYDRAHSKQWSASTESTVRRRLEQSGQDCTDSAVPLWPSGRYHAADERH